MTWNFEKKEKSCISTCPEMGTVSSIFLKKKAENQIKKLCEKFPKLEWMAGLKGEEKDGAYTIEGLVVFDQEVEGAHVEHTPEGDSEFAKHKFIGWIHSHNIMPVGHSADDLNTADQQAISMTVNNKFDIAIKVKKEMSCGRKTLVEGEVVLEREELKVDETWLKEALEKIKEKPRIEVTYEKEFTFRRSQTEKNYCPVCFNQMNQRKAIKCTICNEFVHNKCYDYASGMCSVCAGTDLSQGGYFKKGEFRRWDKFDA